MSSTPGSIFHTTRSLHTHLDAIAALVDEGIAEGDGISLTMLQLCAVRNALEAADNLKRVNDRLEAIFGSGDHVSVLLGRGGVFVEFTREQAAMIVLALGRDHAGEIEHHLPPMHERHATLTAAAGAVRRALLLDDERSA